MILEIVLIKLILSLTLHNIEEHCRMTFKEIFSTKTLHNDTMKPLTKDIIKMFKQKQIDRELYDSIFYPLTRVFLLFLFTFLVIQLIMIPTSFIVDSVFLGKLVDAVNLLANIYCITYCVLNLILQNKSRKEREDRYNEVTRLFEELEKDRKEIYDKLGKDFVPEKIPFVDFKKEARKTTLVFSLAILVNVIVLCSTLFNF